MTEWNVQFDIFPSQHEKIFQNINPNWNFMEIKWFNDFDSFKDKTQENGNVNTFLNMIIHMIYATGYYVKCHEIIKNK